MSVYRLKLPHVFPYYVKASAEQVRWYVTCLLDPEREDVSQGSSFAVTVDNWDGTWNLWLSEASFQYLLKLYPDDSKRFLVRPNDLGE